MMVLTDVANDRCDALSSLFSMSVLNLNTLGDRILATLRGDQEKLSRRAEQPTFDVGSGPNGIQQSS
jgi:hypothetical protein